MSSALESLQVFDHMEASEREPRLGDLDLKWVALQSRLNF